MACKRAWAMWLLVHSTLPLWEAQEWGTHKAPIPGVTQPPVHCNPDALRVHWPTSEPTYHLAGRSTVAAAAAFLRSEKHFKECELVANFKRKKNFFFLKLT